MRTLQLAAGLILSLALAAPGRPPSAAEPATLAPAGQEVLHAGCFWRSNVVLRSPIFRAGTGLKAGTELKVPDGRADLPMPPADWMAPDFDDSAWSSWSRQHPRAPGINCAIGGNSNVALECTRGRFLVADPGQVRGLTLGLEYRGGVVVYLNGQEVARANLPKSEKPDFAALAEDYPVECYMHDGPPQFESNCILVEYGHPKAYAGQIAKRIRKIENVTIDPKLLRKGVNVLAVEVHRTAYYEPGYFNTGREAHWSTCGLIGASLRADGGAAPLDASRAKGPEVWNATTLSRLAPGCRSFPGTKLGPVSIVGCRNGRFCGKVVVSSDGTLKGVKAAATELKTNDGKGIIPAAAVKLLYTSRDDRMTLMKRAPASGFWDTLNEAPAPEIPAYERAGSFQAIWVKVAVGADAAPGDYEGTLTVSAEGLAPVTTPVRFKVHDWKLPDPGDYVSHLGLVQSPDSIALYYKVPLWSEEHWKKMEKSFQLMGEIGCKTLHLPLITRTNFGNEQSLVRWVKDGAGYKYDFTIFDRYLDLAQKHIKPDVVPLYVWESRKYVSRVKAGDLDNVSNPVRVSLLDPATGQVTQMEGPHNGTHYDSPEAVGFWKPVLQEVKARLEKRGLGQAMMIGIHGDGQACATKEDVAMFSACLPGVKWVVNAHPDCRGGNVQGVPVGYNTAVYLEEVVPPPPPWDVKRKVGWRLPARTDAFPRDGCYVVGGRLTPHDSYSLPQHRIFIEGCQLTNLSGLGRTGADFFPVFGGEVQRHGAQGDKFSGTVSARYPESCWDQLNLDRATECLLAPGPDGAASTERYELLREGIQDAEARIFIEKAIYANKLDPALAKKCQEVLDERQRVIRAACTGGWTWFEGPGFAGLSEKLYSCAVEVAAKTGGK